MPLKVAVPFERALRLLHPYNSTLVTSKGRNGKPNVMAVAWIIPVSGNPPLLAMSIRPERYSHKLIRETKEFVVNIPTFNQARKVLICGRRTGRNTDKLKDARFKTEKAEMVAAPLIKECIAHIECKLVKTIKTGDHKLIIGRIVAAQASEHHFKEIYNMKKHRPCLHLGRNYFTTCTEQMIEPKL